MYTLVTHRDPELRARCATLLVAAGRHTKTADPGDAPALLEGDCDAVLCAAERAADAIAIWEGLRARARGIGCVILAEEGTAADASAAMRAGAHDYLVGRVSSEALTAAVDRVAEESALERTLAALPSRARGAARTTELIGESRPMRHLRTLLTRVAGNDATVLLLGETGTGKELAARALHAHSARRAGPFIAVNCAALPADLVESELFGHHAFAFTGADRARPGLFLEATSGTILLDEIGEMPLPAQAKLLRVLQERRVRPVGGSEEMPVDVRVVAATSADLVAEARAGRFREDLRYRLDVVRLSLPPLREREGDVLLLAQIFLDRYAEIEGKPVRSFTRAAARRLIRYGWPGNVRELEACVQRAVVFAQHELVTETDLPERIGPTHRSGQKRFRTEERVPLDVVECAHLARVMREVGGNKTLAAEVLGLDRKTLYRKLRAHGLTDVGEPDDAEPTQIVTVPDGLRD